MHRKSYSNFSFLRFALLMMSTMFMLIGMASSTTREKKKDGVREKDLCLTTSRTAGLVEKSNQYDLIKEVKKALPEHADALDLGVCAALVKIRALISNKDFSRFAMIVNKLRNPSHRDMLAFKVVSAFIFAYQNNLKLPQLEESALVQLQLRNGSVVKANSVSTMADILLKIEYHTTSEIFSIGYGREDWEKASATMQENVVYEMSYFAKNAGMGHVLLLQKCGPFLAIYDPSSGTWAFEHTDDSKFFEEISKEDSALNFLLMHKQRGDISFAPLPPVIRTPKSAVANVFFLEMTLRADNLDFANFLASKRALPDLSSNWGKLSPLAISTTRSNRSQSTEWVLKHGGASAIVLSEALYEAVSLDHIEVARILLSHGAHLNESFPGHETALIKAVQRKNLAMTELLTKHGANLDQSYDDLTPLMWAAHEKCLPIIIELCEKGAKLNIKNAKGTTTLLAAIEAGAGKEIVETLLRYGADPRVDPVRLRNANPNPEIVKLIQDAAKTWNKTNTTEELTISAVP